MHGFGALNIGEMKHQGFQYQTSRSRRLFRNVPAQNGVTYTDTGHLWTYVTYQDSHTYLKGEDLSASGNPIHTALE